MSNVHAAFGLSQINRYDEIKTIRTESIKYFRSLFDNSSIEIEFFEWDEKLIPFMNVALVNPSIKEDLKHYLSTFDIQTGTHWAPGSTFTLFSHCVYDRVDNSLDFYESALSLPLFSGIQPIQLRFLSECLHNYFSK